MPLQINPNSNKAVFVLITSLALALIFNPAAMAEGDRQGGHDFRQAALEYQAEADKFRQKGNFEVAAIYDRLAEIKRHAAELADQERWDEIDWTEYEELTEELEQLLKK
ncbi:MAG: hypothetical protein AB4426_00375 [Xenococcaceae cyanobacterium]